MIIFVIPNDLPLEMLPDGEKLLNKRKFHRRGGTWRRDHGTLAGKRKKYFDEIYDKISARRRRDFRAAGRVIGGN